LSILFVYKSEFERMNLSRFERKERWKFSLD